MNFFVSTVMILVFFYTCGFGISLWKEKNKVGSLAIFILAISIVVTPFFSVFR